MRAFFPPRSPRPRNTSSATLLYEAKIKNMGNARRNGGEYYTPRPLIRAIIKVVDPKIGETIYDGAVSSGGFLCEAFDDLKSWKKLIAKDLSTLQTQTFYGKEKKSLADVQVKDQYDMVLAMSLLHQAFSGEL